MRHNKSFNHLGRKSAHRKAMLSNLASSLIMHKRIETTTAKAKALKRYIEPLITRSKEDTTHSRRVVFSYLQDKEAVTELFREVSTRVADRPGGYTRIIRLGTRQGDNAEMCMMELVDFNELLLGEKAGARKSAGRRRRGGAKKKVEGVTAAATTTVEEAPVEAETAEETPEEAATETATAEEALAEAEVETVEEAPAEAEVETVEEAPAEAETVEEAPAEAETAAEEPETEVKAEADEEEPVAEDESATEDTKDEETTGDDDKKES
jgi:large subunit ribosomal protein L17